MTIEGDRRALDPQRLTKAVQALVGPVQRMEGRYERALALIGEIMDAIDKAAHQQKGARYLRDTHMVHWQHQIAQFHRKPGDL